MVLKLKVYGLFISKILNPTKKGLFTQKYQSNGLMIRPFASRRTGYFTRKAYFQRPYTLEYTVPDSYLGFEWHLKASCFSC